MAPEVLVSPCWSPVPVLNFVPHCIIPVFQLHTLRSFAFSWHPFKRKYVPRVRRGEEEGSCWVPSRNDPETTVLGRSLALSFFSSCFASFQGIMACALFWRVLWAYYNIFMSWFSRVHPYYRREIFLRFQPMLLCMLL